MTHCWPPAGHLVSGPRSTPVEVVQEGGHRLLQSVGLSEATLWDGKSEASPLGWRKHYVVTGCYSGISVHGIPRLPS